MTLEQRAHELAHELTRMRHNIEPRMEAVILAAMKEVERVALERAARTASRFLFAPDRSTHLEIEWTAKQISLLIRALIEAPASEAPDPRDAEIKRLRVLVRTLDEALDSTGRYMVIRHGGLNISQERRRADAARYCDAREAACQTLDREPTGDPPQ